MLDAAGQQQRLAHIKHQQRRHPVIAKPLQRFGEGEIGQRAGLGEEGGGGGGGATAVVSMMSATRVFHSYVGQLQLPRERQCRPSSHDRPSYRRGNSETSVLLLSLRRRLVSHLRTSCLRAGD